MKITRCELIALLQRSKVDGQEEKWNGHKGFIAQCIQDMSNRLNIASPIFGIEIPSDFAEKVNNSNLPKKYKDIILGGRK
jgi:hypothetical protein